MKSARDLCKRALTLLGVIAAGQSAAAEDYDLAVAALRPMLAELQAIGACDIRLHPTDDTREQIPDELFNALAGLLANDVAPAFGATPADEQMRQAMVMRVRRITAAPAFGFPQQVDFF
jgi:hypothetical protein